MPYSYKLCSFDCVYCHYGHTDQLAVDLQQYDRDLPKTADVLAVLKKVLHSPVDFDYITFSGNGEPTLHPDFLRITRGIAELRNTFRPHVKIALLSNSSGLYREDVLHAIEFIDLPIFKLDAGTERLFQSINRPAPGVPFEVIVENLKKLEYSIIQSVFMHGEPSNGDEKSLKTYCAKITEIMPDHVQIYSLDRPVPNQTISRLTPPELVRIAGECAEITGVKFVAYHL